MIDFPPPGETFKFQPYTSQAPKMLGLVAIASFVTMLLCCAGYVGYQAAREKTCNNRQRCVDAGGDSVVCNKRFRCKIRLDVRRRPI